MRSVRVGHLQIAYLDQGEGDPVVLINGTGESGLTWRPLIERLGPGRRYVAYDQRDTGRSSTVEEPYTPADLATDAAGLIEALELGASHIVGYSLGGAVAQELALARPDLVRSLVLLSTWARSDGWFRAQMRSWRSIRRAHADDDDAFLAALAVWLFSPATFARAGEVERLSSLPDSLGEPPQDPEGWMRQCLADEAHDAGERLAALAVPAIVIVGADDVCTPPRYASELATLVPGARLEVVEDAGHAALFERPDEVAALIDGFLGG